MTNRSLIIGKLLHTIQCMIENTLLHSILDIIFEQIERPWRVLQDDSRFNPLIADKTYYVGIRKCKP